MNCLAGDDSFESRVYVRLKCKAAILQIERELVLRPDSAAHEAIIMSQKSRFFTVEGEIVLEVAEPLQINALLQWKQVLQALPDGVRIEWVFICSGSIRTECRIE